MSGDNSAMSGARCVACREEVVLHGLILGVGVALLLAFAPGAEGAPWVRLGLLAPLASWVVVLWLGSLCVWCRRGWAGGRHPALWFGLLLFWAEITAWGAHGVLVPLGVPLPSLSSLLLYTGLIAGVVGGMGWLVVEGYARLLASQAQAAQAELAALQARIRPHFLFNALNTAAALAHARPNLSEQVLVDLAELFRVALEQPRLVPLADELALTRRYLAIEALRMENRLRVRWDVPEPVPRVALPSLAIQPLVENAVRHGVERLREGGEVALAVRKEERQVVVSVRNPVKMVQAASDQPRPHPAPLKDERLGEVKKGGYGVGLAGVQARLVALLGERARLETRIEDGVFEARVSVPLAAMHGPYSENTLGSTVALSNTPDVHHEGVDCRR
ncbi:MAG: histidine kinase [Halothiobacillaceae bacterium]